MWWTNPPCAAAAPRRTKALATPASVLVGDFLYSRAFQMMVDTGSLRVMQVLADATNVIAEGEVQQLMNMHDASLDEAGYLNVIRSKPPNFSKPARDWRHSCRQPTAEIEQSLRHYGQALGTAFQVIDDVLDYDGDAEMGKTWATTCAKAGPPCPSSSPCNAAPPSKHELLRNAIETGSTDELNASPPSFATGALELPRATQPPPARLAMDAAAKLPTNQHLQKVCYN